jgi:hypothetical protein
MTRQTGHAVTVEYVPEGAQRGPRGQIARESYASCTCGWSVTTQSRKTARYEGHLHVQAAFLPRQFVSPEAV